MSAPAQRSFRRTFLVSLAFFCVVGAEFYLFYWLHVNYNFHPALMFLIAVVILFSVAIAAANAVAPPVEVAQEEDKA